MKTPDFMSYERYKKKKNDTSKNGILTAVITFFVALLLFTAVAKSLSPNVDVSIGDDSQTDAKETGLGVKKFIDERLKMIQMEDNSAGVSIKKDNKNFANNDESSNDFLQETEEKMTLPNKKNKNNIAETGGENIDEETIRPTYNRPPRPTSKDLSIPLETPKMSKVYVGRYSTVEQAKVAQEILVDSGLNVTPFIKNLGSYYTLQVGSYSNRATADGLASELQRNSFPARVVSE